MSTCQLLRDHGLRVTAPRQAVLEWLSEHPHATVEQVHEGVSARIGSISKQAVYGVLAAGINAALVRRIKPAGHPARFERSAGDNHHHLVCRTCGHIADAECVAGQQLCLAPFDDRGFELDSAEVVFWGHCSACQAGVSTPSEGAR